MRNIYKRILLFLLFAVIYGGGLVQAQYKLHLPPPNEPTPTPGPTLPPPTPFPGNPVPSPFPLPSPAPKPTLPTEFERCYCVEVRDIPLFRNLVNDFSRDPATRDAFLRAQRQVVIDQVNARLGQGARNLREAMGQYFFWKGRGQSDSGILQAQSKIRSSKNSFDNKSAELQLLDIRLQEIQRGQTNSAFGGIRVNGRPLSNYSNIDGIKSAKDAVDLQRKGIRQQFNPETCYYNPFLQRQICNAKRLDNAVTAAQNDQFSRSGLVAHFSSLSSGNVYDLSGLDQVAAFNKHLIDDIGDIGNEANTYPSIPNYNLADQSLSFLIGKASNGYYNSPQFSADELVERVYFNNYSDAANRFLRNNLNVKREILGVAKSLGYNRNNAFILNELIEDYVAGRNFEVKTFGGGNLTSGGSVQKRSATNPNLALEMSLNSTSKFWGHEGLSNVVSSMDARTDFEGAIIAEFLKNNGINIPSGLDTNYIGRLFEVQYQPISALDRVSIVFKNNLGQQFWNAGLNTYPEVFDHLINYSSLDDFNLLTFDNYDYVLGQPRLTDTLLSFMRRNTGNSKSYNLARDAIRFFRNGNAIEGFLAYGVLTDNSSLIVNLIKNNTEVVNFGKNPLCCPDEYPYLDNDILLAQELGVNIINSAIDGFGNLIIAHLDFTLSDTLEGEIIRVVMEKMGMNIPIDVTNKSLGEIFDLRKRNRELVVEYEKGLFGELLDVGISTLDVVTILSPSKGGGAYLAMSGGGKITAAALSRYLKRISPYIKGLPKRIPRGKAGTPARVYQEKVAGPSEFLLSSGNNKIWADGINFGNGNIIEAKHVGNAASSPYVPGSSIPDDIRQKIIDETINEFIRYKSILADPNIPFQKLEVITNNAQAKSFFENLLKELGIVGDVILKQ